MNVIAVGRCPVASVLLALNLIGRQHANDAGKATIDESRRELGRSMLRDCSDLSFLRS